MSITPMQSSASARHESAPQCSQRSVAERTVALQPRQYPAWNFHGQRSIAGVGSLITQDRRRKINRANKLTARPKNRLNDPLSYLHILEAMLQVDPNNHLFSTKDFVELLDAYKPMLRWDTVTVGRIVSDIAESLSLRVGRPAIEVTRTNHRSTYVLHATIEARTAMENLLLDLLHLCETGFEIPRQMRPLDYCKSLKLPDYRA